MARNSDNYVDIDVDNLAKAIRLSGKTAEKISVSIGRAETYLKNCKKSGKIHKYALPLLARELSVSEKDIVAFGAEIKDEAQKAQIDKILENTEEAVTLLKKLYELLK